MKNSLSLLAPFALAAAGIVAPDDEVTFRRVTIVDAEGRPAIELDGEGRGIAIRTPDGMSCVVIGATKEGVGTIFTLRRGGRGANFCVRIGATLDGGGQIVTHGSDGKERVRIDTMWDGGGRIETYGPDEKKRVSIGTLELEGGGRIVSVYGPTGSPHVRLGAVEDGGVISVHKPSGKVIWGTPVP